MKIWKEDVEKWETVREGVKNRLLAEEEFSALSMIKFEKGAMYPLHQAKSRHFGVLIKGKGIFQSSKNKVAVNEGDAFLVEAGEDHAFTNTADGESIVMEIFVPPSDRQLSLAEKLIETNF